jgi:hypothetical protein
MILQIHNTSTKMQVLFMTEHSLPKPPIRRYYVEIDNIIIPPHLKGIKAFEAATTNELLDKIIDYYGFKWQYKNSLQLWSNKKGLLRERLDEMEVIPEKYEFIYVRGITK